MVSMEVFGGLLLDLYRASREMAAGDFQQYAIGCVRRYIPFDIAGWAMWTRKEDGRQHIYDCYIVGVPEDSGEWAKLVGANNLVGRTCWSSPGVCFYFSPAQVFGDPQVTMMARHIGFTHLLCINWLSSIPWWSTFLVLGRRNSELPFTEDERHLTECLMPHLADMWRTALVKQLAAIRTRDSGSRSAMAVFDAMGKLLEAEPGFKRLMHLEWPGWDAPLLPAPLLEATATRRDRYLGEVVQVRFEPIGESRLVTVARRAPGDVLSPRERSVAEGFARGATYKELAKQLELSPATVRHHLRSIYQKLGVADKAALAMLLAEQPIE